MKLYVVGSTEFDPSGTDLRKDRLADIYGMYFEKKTAKENLENFIQEDILRIPGEFELYHIDLNKYEHNGFHPEDGEDGEYGEYGEGWRSSRVNDVYVLTIAKYEQDYLERVVGIFSDLNKAESSFENFKNTIMQEIYNGDQGVWQSAETSIYVSLFKTNINKILKEGLRGEEIEKNILLSDDPDQDAEQSYKIRIIDLLENQPEEIKDFDQPPEGLVRIRERMRERIERRGTAEAETGNYMIQDIDVQEYEQSDVEMDLPSYEEIKDCTYLFGDPPIEDPNKDEVFFSKPDKETEFEESNEDIPSEKSCVNLYDFSEHDKDYFMSHRNTLAIYDLSDRQVRKYCSTRQLLDRYTYDEEKIFVECDGEYNERGKPYKFKRYFKLNLGGAGNRYVPLYQIQRVVGDINVKQWKLVKTGMKVSYSMSLSVIRGYVSKSERDYLTSAWHCQEGSNFEIYNLFPFNEKIDVAQSVLTFKALYENWDFEKIEEKRFKGEILGKKDQQIWLWGFFLNYVSGDLDNINAKYDLNVLLLGDEETKAGHTDSWLNSIYLKSKINDEIKINTFQEKAEKLILPKTHGVDEIKAKLNLFYDLITQTFSINELGMMGI